MSPKMIVSKDGVRYPRDFAEEHGIEAAREIDTPTAADRTHTHAGIGIVVQDDAAGTVISSTGVNQGLAVPATDPAVTEAAAAAEAGKGSVGTTGAPDNTESGANDGGTTSGDDAATGDADGTPAGNTGTRSRAAKGK